MVFVAVLFERLECNFCEENLKTALFCNTFIYKLKVILVLKLYNVWNLFMEKTNKFIEKTDHTTLN